MDVSVPYGDLLISNENGGGHTIPESVFPSPMGTY